MTTQRRGAATFDFAGGAVEHQDLEVAGDQDLGAAVSVDVRGVEGERAVDGVPALHAITHAPELPALEVRDGHSRQADVVRLGYGQFASQHLYLAVVIDVLQEEGPPGPPETLTSSSNT